MVILCFYKQNIKPDVTVGEVTSTASKVIDKATSSHSGENSKLIITKS